MNNTESKLISAVLEDKQMHVMLQANADKLLRTHGDIWEFIRHYFEQNSAMPPTSLIVEKFRDFEPVQGIGSTKHHLDELQAEYLNDNLKDILRNAATEVQSGRGVEALEGLISKTSELKKDTAVIRDVDVTDLESALQYKHGSRASHHSLSALRCQRQRFVTVSLQSWARVCGHTANFLQVM